MSKAYAGIGSRQTPPAILEIMREIAVYMYERDYVLRSGGADGADTAFEGGHDMALGKRVLESTCDNLTFDPTRDLTKKEVYLPWANFNGRKNSNHGMIYTPSLDNWSEALRMIEKIHPNPEALTRGSRALHARNCYQILGKSLNDPVSVVFCWTDPSYKTGGTRTAVMLAKEWSIPIWNLAIEEILLNVKMVLANDKAQFEQGVGSKTQSP